MKKTLIAAAVTFIAATSIASANPFAPIDTNNDVLINKPIVAQADELACFGCISPSTGRFRDGFVRPHFRSNGSFVNGYWRS
jgi:hypothetical protein